MRFLGFGADYGDIVDIRFISLNLGFEITGRVMIYFLVVV